jgi:hypothetical protein
LQKREETEKEKNKDYEKSVEKQKILRNYFIAMRNQNYCICTVENIKKNFNYSNIKSPPD